MWQSGGIRICGGLCGGKFGMEMGEQGEKTSHY